MQLLVSDTSPYARKCRVLLREFGLIDQVDEVDAHPFEDGAKLLAANPLGRVPCLVMDDGRALTESSLIAAWLNQKSTHGWDLGWDDRRLEALGTGLLDLAVGRRIEMVRDQAIYSDYWISRRERGISRALEQLEDEIAVASSIEALGPLTIAIALDYLDFRYPDLNWRDGHAQLEALHEKWARRASFAKTAPPADA
jgi:glutathione S-transferase